MTPLDLRLHSELNGGFDFRLFHRVVDPFVRAPAFHCHPEFEIALFLSGNGLYYVSDRKYPIRRGDLFFFSSNEPHYITRIDRGELMHSINLHFTRGLVSGPYADAFDAQYLRVFLNRRPEYQHRLACTLPIAGSCIVAFEEIERYLTNGDAQSLPMAKARLQLMLAEIAGAVQDQLQDARPLRPEADARLQAAMRYIEQHLTEPLELERMSRACGLSRNYLSGLFRRTYGIPLWHYITAKRVQRAIELLQQTDDTKLDIALKSGFNNTANFNRAFKQMIGKTPTEYLRGL